MPDTTDATARAVKLTGDQETVLGALRAQNRAMTAKDLMRTGYVPARLNIINVVAIMGSLRNLGLLAEEPGDRFPPLMRAHPAARPRPDAAHAGN